MSPRPQRPQGPSGQQQPLVPKKDYGADFRGIVRLVGKELKGELPLQLALTRIKGLGVNFSKVISGVIEKVLGIPHDKPVGQLTDEQLGKIEELLKAPEKYLNRPHIFNRPSDPDLGTSRHILANDLIFANRQDVQFEKDSRTWVGWRHSLGQRVRGQHSRTTGRTGMSVGVLKKAIKQQKTAAASKAQETSAPKVEKK